jgi:hypothetical protein
MELYSLPVWGDTAKRRGVVRSNAGEYKRLDNMGAKMKLNLELVDSRT